MSALLSFERAPPIAAPLRFFLTAPLFGVLAGLLLAIDGGAALGSRWTPSALALTHLLTAGFMLQAMLGASIQVLPVVAGAALARPLPVARAVHGALLPGALLLAGGLRLGSRTATGLGALLVAAAVGLFLAAAAGLYRLHSTSPTVRGAKFAFGALAVVALLGTLLAWGVPIDALPTRPGLTDLHAGWGLGGWAGMLIAAVAYVVVPMFQLTPGYPERPAWLFPLAMTAALAAWAAAALLGLAWLVRTLQFALAAAGIAFAVLTLRLQARRRRAKADALSRYWRLGMGAAALALAMAALAALVPALATHAAWTPVFGILLIVGGFVSLIAGMLCKITPFLAWMHLQQHAQGKVPPMNQFLADDETRGPWFAHVVALVLLAATPLLPVLARPAGLAFAVACGWLGWNVLLVARRYRQHARGPIAS